MSEPELRTYDVYFNPKDLFYTEVKAYNQAHAILIAFGKLAKKMCTRSSYEVECEWVG